MLTAQQNTILKSFVDSDPVLSLIPRNDDGFFEIARLLNLAASPQYIVWKTSANIDEIMRNGMDWTRVDNLSIGKARIWDWLTRLGSLNPSKANIRAGIDATWVGTAADLAVRAVVYTHCKRDASVFEKLFSTGIGTEVSPSTMELEGPITFIEVAKALSI